MYLIQSTTSEDVIKLLVRNMINNCPRDKYEKTMKKTNTEGHSDENVFC